MKSLRWNPFAMWSDHCQLVERVVKAEAEVKALGTLLSMTNDRITKLVDAPKTASNIEQPLDEDQRKLVEIFLQDKSLREKKGSRFASGGPVNRRSTDRFGEAPSEQLRAADYHAPEPVVVQANKDTTGEEIGRTVSRMIMEAEERNNPSKE